MNKQTSSKRKTLKPEERLESGYITCFLCGKHCGTDEKNNWVKTKGNSIIYFHSACFEKEYGGRK